MPLLRRNRYPMAARRGEAENEGSGDRISEMEVLVFRLLQRGEWMTNRQIAVEANIAERTARGHTMRMTLEGVVDCQRRSPAYRYRRSPSPPRTSYRERLVEAAAASSGD